MVAHCLDTGTSIKSGGVYASSIDPSFSLNFAAEEITPSYVENICSENQNLLNSFIF